MPQVPIRAMTAADTNHVATLLRQSFDTGLHPYIAYCQVGTAQHLSRCISDQSESRMLAVATMERQLVGFADVRVGTTSTYLSYIATARRALGKGVATALLHHAFHANPSLPMDLHVFDDNHPAIDLYTKLGFKPTGELYWTIAPISLEAPSRTNWLVPNAYRAAQELETFGFSSADIESDGVTITVGLPSPTVARIPVCSTPDSLMMQAAIGKVFPQIKEVLTIGPRSSDTPGRQVLKRLIQMTRIPPAPEEN